MWRCYDREKTANGKMIAVGNADMIVSLNCCLIKGQAEVVFPVIPPLSYSSMGFLSCSCEAVVCLSIFSLIWSSSRGSKFSSAEMGIGEGDPADRRRSWLLFGIVYVCGRMGKVSCLLNEKNWNFGCNIILFSNFLQGNYEGRWNIDFYVNSSNILITLARVVFETLYSSPRYA